MYLEIEEATVVHSARPMFPRELIQQVADIFDVSYGEVIGNRRFRKFIYPRVAISRFLRDRGWSYCSIARLLGGRDRTSVQNICGKFDYYNRCNPMVGEAVNMMAAQYRSASHG